MNKVTRFGVSLEAELLDRFDGYITRKGYPTRSEAIRELIDEALAKETIEEGNGHAIGTITLLYDHQKGGVKEKLMEIQHRHHDVISSSVHIHLDLERCLEVLIVHGSVPDVDKLAEELTGVKGVLHGGPILIAGELATHQHDLE